MIFTFFLWLARLGCFTLAFLLLAAAVKLLVDGWRRMNDGAHKATRRDPDLPGVRVAAQVMTARHALREAVWAAAPVNLPSPASPTTSDRAGEPVVSGPVTATRTPPALAVPPAGPEAPWVNWEMHEWAAEALRQQAARRASTIRHMTAVAQAVHKARTIEKQPAARRHAEYHQPPPGDQQKQGCWPMADPGDFTESAWTKRTAAQLALQLARAETDAGFDAIRPRELCEYAFSGILPRWTVAS